MANKTIDEVTLDTAVSGTEKIPVSDSGTAKAMTAATLKQYVIDAIEALTAAETINLTNDKIFVGIKNGSVYDMKPISGTTLCDAVYALMFDKEAVTSYSTADKLVIRQGSTTKRTTLGDLCDYLKEQIDPEFDINALATASDLADENQFAVAQSTTSGGTTTWTTLKKTLSALKDYVLGKLNAYAVDTSSIGDNDTLLLTTSEGVVKKAKKSALGITNGDVVGPVLDNITDGNIPLWNKGTSETQKKLKEGLGVDAPASTSTSTTISSTSTDSQVPTSRNVYLATGDKVSGISSSTDGYIPQWNGTGGKTLKAGLGVLASNNDATTVLLEQYATDSTMPTAKNVRLGILTRIAKLGDGSTDGNIPQWDGTDGNALKAGLGVTTSISSNSTDSQVPTAKSVYNTTADKVSGISLSTDGDIPQWDGTGGKTLKAGLGVVASSNDATTISSSSTDAQVPTAKNVHLSITSRINNYSSLPEITDDEVKHGQLAIYYGAKSGIALYVAWKSGSSTSDYEWIKVGQVISE